MKFSNCWKKSDNDVLANRHPIQMNKNKNSGSANQIISPVSSKVRELLNEQCGGLPVWIRSPKQGPEHYTGFSRAKLYELAGQKAIRSVSVRQPGQVKGTRLFLLQSILDFITRCENESTFVE